MSFPTKPNLEEFWRLESIGITDSPLDSDNDKSIKLFNETHKYDNDRYSVTWPWKDDKSCLPENRELAFGRLKSLVNKLRNHPQLVDKYDEIIQNQLKLGVIEKVASNTKETTKHYIPHHPVINPGKPKLKEGKKKSQYIAQVGDVVLIKDDLPRGNWRLGRITDLIKSYDNHTRAAKVLLPTNRVISRPLNLLYPVECPSEMNRDNYRQDDKNIPTSDQPTDEKTRRKPPIRDAAQSAMRKIKEQLKQ